MIPIVVGKLAAQTPSLLMVASVPSATASGLAQPKQPVSPGTSTWMCPESALSETPDSNQIWSTSLHIELTAIRALQLSTQLRTRSTWCWLSMDPLVIRSFRCSQPQLDVMFMLYASMIISGLISMRVYLAAWALDRPTCIGVKNSRFMFASSTLSQSQKMSLPIPQRVSIQVVTEPIPPTPMMSTDLVLMSAQFSTMPIFLRAIRRLYGLSSFTSSLMPYLLQDLDTISLILASSSFFWLISYCNVLSICGSLILMKKSSDVNQITKDQLQ